MVVIYLKQLLQEKDEVIVNDLGTFVAIYGSAEVHPATHTFSPPCKNITFNSKLKLSNQILEQYIAKNENISVEKAADEVRSFVTLLKVELGVQKRYTIPELGEFSIQLSDQPEFKSSKDFNFLNDSFGLPEILSKPIERSEGEQNQVQQRQTALLNKKNANSSILTPNKPVGEEGKKKSWGTFAAIGSLALVSFAVVYILFIDTSLNPFKHLLASSDTTKNTPPKDEKEKVILDTASKAKNTPDTSRTNAKITENTSSTEEAKKTEDTKTTEEAKKNNKNNDGDKDGKETVLNAASGKYYIVLGGFGNIANAQKKLQEVQATGKTSVKIIPPYGGKNIYRVVLGTFASQNEADTQANSLRGELGKDIWVLKY